MSTTASNVARIALLEDLDLSEADHRRDFQLDAPVLVLWMSSTAEIEVRRSDGARWRYRPRPGMLDLFGAGGYDTYHATGGRRHKLVLRTTPDWFEARHGRTPHGHAQPPILTRIQFHDRALERLMHCLRRHHAAGQPRGTPFSDALLVAITDRLSHAGAGAVASDGEGARLSPALQQLLKDLIEQGLGDPPSIDAMAALAAMGTSLFLRAFRASFGMSPHQYVLSLRVEAARRLLAAEEEASLSDVAARLGFASHAHFTTVFRARTGMTPSDYRRAHAPRTSGFGGLPASPADSGCTEACR